MYKRKTRKKNKVWFGLAIMAVLIITGIVFVLVGGGKKGYRTIGVVEVFGTVSVVKDGIEYGAYPGMMLQEGHAVVTSGDSYVRMVLDGDKYVKLESGSRAIFETLGFLGSGKTSIKLERGALTGEVVNPLGDDEEFVINTPNAVLAVRGTFFRVDLGFNEKGEITTDVKTYGGRVAACRVMPNGEKLQEEVLIETGYKATINMTDKITYYVGENEEGDKIAVEQPVPDKAEQEGYALTTLIRKEEISDDDLVDIYFAVENGHEMFWTKEEIPLIIEERGIELNDCVSVYDISEEILTSIEKGNEKDAGKSRMLDAIYVADDSRPLMRTEESASSLTKQPEATASIVPAPTATTEPMPTMTSSPAAKPTAVPAPTVTAVPSSTATAAPSPTATAAPSPTATAVPSPTATAVPSPTVTAAPSPTATAVPSPTATAVPSLTVTAVPSPMVTATPSPTVTVAPSPTVTVVPSPTATAVPSPTVTVTPIPTATVAPSPTATVAPSPTATVAPSPTATVAPSPTVTVAPSPTATVAPSPTATAVPSPTATVAPTPIATAAPVAPTATPTAAPSPTPDVEVHEHEELVEETEATCDTPGRKIVSCKVCGEVLSEEEIPAIGHSYSEWQTIMEPTCSLAGKVKRICEVCGSEETETKVVLGHDYATEFTVDTEATCTVAGSKSKHCSRCESTSEVTEIPATGHGYSEWQTKTEATCTAEGLKTRTCTTDGCGYEEEGTIEALGHDYATEFTIDTEATCMAVGSKSRHCSRCESTTDITEIAVLAHNYGEWQTLEEATCADEGRKRRVCQNTGCGYIDVQTVEALGHFRAGEGSPTICDRCNATWIDVNSTVFPDAAFRTYVEEQLDTDGNGSLIGDELTAVTSIEVSGTGYTNLQGISYFTELATLKCTDTANLTRLDLDSNTKLNELTLTGCGGLTSLNVTGCTNLLTIDLSDCTGLTDLGAANSGVYNLNMPGGPDENASLVNVNLSNTSIMDLYLLYCPDLESITVDGSAIEVINLDEVSAASVKNISAVNCTSLRAINVSGGLSICTSLESVNVTGCSSLGSLEFSNNANLTSLKVDGCTSLAALSINGTNITDIAAMGLSGAISLQYFQAFNANLDDADMAVIQTSLPITLKEFRVGENPDITTLSLYNMTELTVVDLMYCTGLTGIDLTGCNPYGALEVIATGTELEKSNCTGWNDLWTFTK